MCVCLCIEFGLTQSVNKTATTAIWGVNTKWTYAPKALNIKNKKKQQQNESYYNPLLNDWTTHWLTDWLIVRISQCCTRQHIRLFNLYNCRLHYILSEQKLTGKVKLQTNNFRLQLHLYVFIHFQIISFFFYYYYLLFVFYSTIYFLYLYIILFLILSVCLPACLSSCALYRPWRIFRICYIRLKRNYKHFRRGTIDLTCSKFVKAW